MLWRGGAVKTYRVYISDEMCIVVKAAKFEIYDNIVVFLSAADNQVAVFFIKNIKGFEEVQ